MKKAITLILFICIVLIAQSQNFIKPKLNEKNAIGKGVKSVEFVTPLFKEINTPSADLNWKPSLLSKCKAHIPKSENDLLIKKIKDEQTAIKLNSTNNFKSGSTITEPSNPSTIAPVVGINFLGNENNGNSPMDNNIAISNGGWIVSVANTTIEFDNSATGTTVSWNTIPAFFNDPSIVNVCDPLVLYDSGSDRFIFFAQECSGSSSNTFLLLAFSKTNDPTAGWWTYKIPASPTSASTWFDYPKMAVSNNELYVTGNLYTNAGSFVQSILFQIPKAAAFAGSSITWQYFTSITGSPFTMLPVSNGIQGNYGPGCFLVSTNSGGSSSINLYDLTDDMSASNEQLLHYSIPTTAYSPAGNSQQASTSCLLDNGDCRTLSGFYLNGIIHFVFHSNAGSGWNGINYNRLDVSALQNQSSMFSAVGSKDYSYPAIASFANNINDKSVIIGFGASNASIFPEVRAVRVDDNMIWSTSTLVKSSASYASFTSTSSERWGDYTGACRKYNSATPSVWINGMYANNTNTWDTWIAQIGGLNQTGIINNEKSNQKLNVFPNPISETFSLEFDMPNSDNITIEISDIQGKTVKQLYNGYAHMGLNSFSFNKSQLSAGTYFLIIKNQTNILKNEKINISN